jgi:phosphoribosylanthranilate isomerase
MKVRVKICGIKTLEIAEAAIEDGTDALGFVFYEKSPRNIGIQDAKKIILNLPPFVNKVGVFVDKGRDDLLKIIEETGIDTIQVHGDSEIYSYDFVKDFRERTNLPIIMVVRVDKLDNKTISNLIENPVQKKNLISAWLVDKYSPEAFGGTGKSVGFESLEGEIIEEFIKKRVIIAGGLNSSNIYRLIETIVPYGIDVSSGVEKEKGVKDKILIKEFLEAVRILNNGQF